MFNYHHNDAELELGERSYHCNFL